MKCKHCNGTGYNDTQRGAIMTEFPPCPWCGGSGYVKDKEQTNEEWMKSLDTEELVDLLYEVHKDGASVERQAWIEKHKERIKMQIRGWLKETHDGKQRLYNLPKM